MLVSYSGIFNERDGNSFSLGTKSTTLCIKNVIAAKHAKVKMLDKFTKLTIYNYLLQICYIYDGKIVILIRSECFNVQI